MLAKDAFDSVCNLVFENVKSDDWKYSKSKHWMTKKDGQFMYRVYFYTSWRNISDSNVSFYGECAIISLKSKEKVFHLSNHRCGIPKEKLDWNVAKKESWNRAVEEFTTWLNTVFIPIVDRFSNDLDNYIHQVVSEGFYPKLGYLIDIDFVLQYGSRELAEKAVINYYNSLNDYAKKRFKENYESMIVGNEAVNVYGKNHMLNHCNFRTIIENKIIVKLS